MIQYEEIHPYSKDIAPYVHLYSFSIGTLQEMNAKYITRALPAFLIQFYFEFEGDLAEIGTQTSKQTIKRKGYINTCKDEWIDIFQTQSRLKSRQVKNFKVDLYPHALYEIFGLSPLEISTMSGELKEVWGNGYSALFDELEHATNTKEAMRIFETHFRTKMLSSTSCARIQSSLFLKQHDSLKSLSSHLGYSSRWIQKQHLEIFGISFKKAQGMMRFSKTVQYIALQTRKNKLPLNLTEVAYENGYFDQAHFIKEFKRYSGMTPTEYIRKKFGTTILFFW